MMGGKIIKSKKEREKFHQVLSFSLDNFRKRWIDLKFEGALLFEID